MQKYHDEPKQYKGYLKSALECSGRPTMLIQRLLSPIVDVRKEEVKPLLLMFLYSFLVIASYSIMKPLTRAQYIDDLGADNLPYVLLASGLVIGFCMQGFTRVTAVLPPRSVIPLTLSAVSALLVVFWVLFESGQGQTWTSIAFYLLGQIFALLLIKALFMTVWCPDSRSVESNCGIPRG